MSLNYFTLNKEKPSHRIELNPERPFLKITYLSLPFLTKENENDLGVILRSVKIKARRIGWNGESNYYMFQGGMRSGILSVSKNEILIEKVVSNSEYDDVYECIEFDYETTNVNDLELRVHYECVDRSVKIQHPLKEFGKHISFNDNIKIFFSAPFGQGKTTFLDYFFELNSNQYEVFKVFPVNYSISHNEDVFKYIKCEILFQLLGKDVEFDETDISFFETLPDFLKKDPLVLFAPLAPMLPKAAKSVLTIAMPLYKLVKKCFEYHKNSQKSDEAEAESFIKELYTAEGSIFEDNFYTQLIRQLLARLKKKSGKQNVLIIEDLDRMDPDHIFRILNVFAAHFDSSEFNYGLSNKFGFDKIIVVGDYTNIRHIYEYRYGPKVAFVGYINKYYSRHPFNYDNREAISRVVEDIFPTNVKYEYLVRRIFLDMAQAEAITLRELLKFTKFEDGPAIVYGDHSKSKISKEHLRKMPFMNLICYFSRIIDPDSLLTKLRTMKSKVSEATGFNYNASTQLGFVSLAKPVTAHHYSYVYKEVMYTFSVRSLPGSENYEPFEFEKRTGTNEVKFSHDDFYEILYLNVEKYKEVGGFE
ncbi:MAG: hypothetical protein JWO09_760 [Bacteroidetes bacterium]|nr:hypothetical protein [Bacteroidota bacterium]